MWSRKRKAAPAMLETPQICSSASPASHKPRSRWFEAQLPGIWDRSWQRCSLLGQRAHRGSLGHVSPNLVVISPWCRRPMTVTGTARAGKGLLGAQEGSWLPGVLQNPRIIKGGRDPQHHQVQHQPSPTVSTPKPWPQGIQTLLITSRDSDSLGNLFQGLTTLPERTFF